MVAISTFSIANLRNEELLGFCQDIAYRIAEAKTLADADAVKTFREEVRAYAGELDVTRDINCQHIIDADAQVDSAVSGLRAHLQVLLNYPKDSVREAARKIWCAIEPYGCPTQLSYNEEYAIVARMLETLEGLDSQLLLDATVEAWLPALRTRYDAFMALRKDFNAERASQPAGRVKTSKQSLSNAWRTLCNYLNGLAIVQPSSELDALIGDINVSIQTKKNTLKVRKSTKKTAAEAASEAVAVDE